MSTVEWMADTLRTAGVRVVEYDGWRTRATSGTFTPRAVLWHHDASAAGPSPSMPHMIAEIGNTTTPPPLSQAWVDTAGVWHLIAAGRANHAGIGAGWGRIPANEGNRYAIGVETDHTAGEPWPAALLAGLRRGTAAILKHLGASATDALAGHKEYAPGRKTDPAGLDMSGERKVVAELMEDEMPLTDQEIEREWRWKVDDYTKPHEAGKPAPTMEAYQALASARADAWFARQDLAAFRAEVAGQVAEMKTMIAQAVVGQLPPEQIEAALRRVLAETRFTNVAGE